MTASTGGTVTMGKADTATFEEEKWGGLGAAKLGHHREVSSRGWFSCSCQA